MARWFDAPPDGAHVPRIELPDLDHKFLENLKPNVAFKVPTDRIDEYVQRLRAAGVECSEVFNHDESPMGISPHLHDEVFVRSVYFRDPDGILLEFACWTRELGPGDVRHEPARAGD